MKRAELECVHDRIPGEIGWRIYRRDGYWGYPFSAEACSRCLRCSPSYVQVIFVYHVCLIAFGSDYWHDQSLIIMTSLSLTTSYTSISDIDLPGSGSQYINRMLIPDA